MLYLKQLNFSLLAHQIIDGPSQCNNLQVKIKQMHCTYFIKIKLFRCLYVNFLRCTKCYF